MWLACMVLIQAQAEAYVLKSASLRSSSNSSRLIFTADNTVKFRVNLTGPKNVVLHLPGAHLSTDMPKVDKDPLIQSIKVETRDKGISLLISTRMPGITVLPSYEAVSRRLTLEFGGPAGFEQTTEDEYGLPPADPELSLNPPEPRAPVVKADQSKQPLAAAGGSVPAPERAEAQSAKAEPVRQEAGEAQPPGKAPATQLKTKAAPQGPEPQAAPPAPKPKANLASGVIPPPPEPLPKEVGGGPAEPTAAQTQTALRIPVPVPDPETAPRDDAGQPSIETGQNITMEQAPAEPKPPAKTIAEPAEPALSEKDQAKAGPEPAAEPAEPVVQAEPQTPAPQVLRIRRGTHPKYTRVVLDGDAPMTAHIVQEEKQLILSLERGDLAAKATVAKPDRRTKAIEVIQKSPLRIMIGLNGWLSSHKLFYLLKGRKVVLDFEISQKPPKPKPKSEVATPEKPQTKLAGAKPPESAKAEIKPRAESKPQKEQAPEPKTQAVAAAPVPEPKPALEPVKAGPAPRKSAPPTKSNMAVIGPEPRQLTQSEAQARSAALNQIQSRAASRAIPPPPPEPEASGESIPIERPRQSKPQLKDLAQKPPLPVPLATRARVHPHFRTYAKGSIPPIPTPPPLARPRGPVTQVEEPIATTAGGEVPAPTTRDVLQKVAQAEAESQAESETESRADEAQKPAAPKPVVVADRPPQAALLGAAGKQDIEATRAFENAKAEFDSRRYQQALDGFKAYLEQYPEHRLAGEATFRMADAFFNLHERGFQPYYNDAMKYYQRGIDLYPQSDQVPWALLMMGRAAMLGGEPFKAAGYFEVVVADYPKSEYVPLALVQRAQAYMAEGKINRALEEFRLVSERYPYSRYRKDADWGQAQALFNMSRYQRASLLLKDMDRRDPQLRIKEPELLYYIGEAEFQQKNYAEARSHFLWALNIMPNLPDNDIVLTRVGDTYKFEGDHNAAKDIYRRVVNMFPDTDGALVSRIRLAESPAKAEGHDWDIFKVEATTDAFKTYREIATKYPEREVSELARLKMGVYYFKKKDFELAMETLLGLLRDNPHTIFKPQINYTANLIALGIMDELHKKGKPMALMNTYWQYQGSLTRPNGNTVLKHLAWAYEMNGWFERSAGLYKTLLQRGVDTPKIKLDYARVLLKNRKYETVPDLLNDEVTRKLDEPLLTQARSVLGRAYQHLGKYRLARANLRLAVGRRPLGPGAAEDYYALGRANEFLNEPMEALAALEHSSNLLLEEKGPASKSLNYLVCMDGGAAALDARRVDKAKEFYQRAVEMAPSPPEKGQAMYKLAETQKEVGQTKEAAATWTKLAQLKVNPWSEMAVRHLADMQLAPSLARVGK
jgi:TolA-binding protein